MSARTRELFGLLPVSLLVAAGFAAVLAILATRWLVTRPRDGGRRSARLGIARERLSRRWRRA